MVKYKSALYSPVLEERRNFLMALGFLAVAPGFVAAQLGRTSNNQIETRLLSILGARESAVFVGRAVLQSHQVSSHRHELLIASLDSLGLSASSAMSMDSISLKKRYLHQLANDFDSGRTINVEGWSIAWVEANLSALAAAG
jgi:hypothetical protein